MKTKITMNKSELLEWIKSNAIERKHEESIPLEYWKDKDVVKEIVKHKNIAWYIKYASDEIRDDEEVLSIAVKSDVYAFKYASDRLRNDKDFVLPLIKQSRYIVQYVGSGINSIMADKEFILESIVNENAVQILQYISYELKQDKELLLALVKANPKVIFAFPKNLKDDFEVLVEMEKYYKENPEDIEDLNDEFKEWYESSMRILEAYRIKNQMVVGVVKKDKIAKF
jgi:hypothetical protein